MNDKDLLEAAAKAAGIPIYEWRYNERTDSWQGARADSEEATVYWSPLTNDGDAFRLASKLMLDVLCHERGAMVYDDKGHNCDETGHADPVAGARRAVVRVAAEIGKGTK